MAESDNSYEHWERRAQDWWDNWSEQFQEAYGDGATAVGVAFGPGVPDGEDLGLLGDVDGTRVIELGCGGGQFGIALAKQGAAVTGVDISAEQLSYARELADEHDVELDLVESSVTDLPMIDDASYELAVSAFAFQWVEDLQGCFEEAHRILEPGGRLVFSVDHPMYRCLDPETGDLTISYFDDSPRREYSEAFDAEMVIYRRRISDIVTALLEAGFTIDALREPGYEEPEAYDSEYGSFKPERMANVPPTLVVAAQT